MTSLHLPAQFESDERKADPIRVFREDGTAIGGTVDGVEAACEAVRQDAEKRKRWSRYAGFRPGDVVPVQMIVRRLFGRYEVLILKDPRNPKFTDEQIMARFEDPEEAA